MSRRRVTGWLSSLISIRTGLSSEQHRCDSRAAAFAIGVGLLASAFAVPAIGTPVIATQIYQIDVAAGPAQESLAVLSRQASLTISLEEPQAGSAVTRAVTGAFTPAAALNEMLSGSGLVWVSVGQSTVEVRRDPGGLRWYDIPASPALEGISKFAADTLEWEVLVEGEDAVARMRTSAVRGCLTPETAARKLFASTALAYEWVRPEGTPARPDGRSLIVRAAASPRWARVFRRPPLRPIFAESDGVQCRRFCTAEGSETAPPEICVKYAVAID